MPIHKTLLLFISFFVPFWTMAQPVRQPETLLRIVVTETDKGEPLAYAQSSAA